jgi:ABC-2 type transport system ATP-binding protein
MNSKYILADKLSYVINSKTILNSVDLAIAEGDCVALVGANGCGKTTLIKLLCGLLQPATGSLHIANLSHQNPAHRILLKQLFGFAPDQPPLYPNDTVYSYLLFKAQLYLIPKTEIPTRITTLLERFALSEYRNNRLHTLSKGTQQRVNLAQALIHKPKILIMDEPSNALDPEQLANFCALIKTLRQEQITILIASHDYNDMIPLCDYMLRINSGQINKIPTPLQKAAAEITHDQFDYTT